jgi:hypothetical protein
VLSPLRPGFTGVLSLAKVTLGVISVSQTPRTDLVTRATST